MMTMDKMTETLTRVFGINMENVAVTKIGEHAGWLSFWGWTEAVEDFINFCKDVADKRFVEDDHDVFMIKGLLLYVDVDDPIFYDDVEFDIDF